MINFTFINDWAQLFSKNYNWKNYRITFFNLEFEDDVVMASYDLIIVILGIGVLITYSTSKKTCELIEIERRLEEYESGKATTTKGIPWEEVRAQLTEGRCPRCYFLLDGSEE
jgi:hypothetical protein